MKKPIVFFGQNRNLGKIYLSLYSIQQYRPNLFPLQKKMLLKQYSFVSTKSLLDTCNLNILMGHLLIYRVTCKTLLIKY